MHSHRTLTDGMYGEGLIKEPVPVPCSVMYVHVLMRDAC